MKRRTFLLGALGTTAALALGVSLYRPELSLDEDADPDHRLLFGVLLPVMLDGALPETPGPREAALNRTQEAIVATIKVLPESARQELQLLLDMLDNRLGLLLLTGNMTPMLLRSPSELNQLLTDWREQTLTLFNQAYLGLREIVMASYYSCPEHWVALNYVKPNLSAASTGQ